MKLRGVPGAEASVQLGAGEDGIDRSPQEYLDQEDERADHDKISVSYIEVVSGSKFALRIKLSRSLLRKQKGDALQCATMVDGQCAQSIFLDMDRWSNDEFVHWVHGAESAIDNQRYLQRFKFGDLKTSKSRHVYIPCPYADLDRTIDDDTKTRIEYDALKRLGEIDVMLWFVRKVADTQHSGSVFTPSVNGSVHEKCLKGRAISQKVE